MSIYFEQYAHQTDFKTSESWVVLSPIEKQIKQKIEAIGTPLKEWDLSINYGIKTGFNEAFIITSEKRKELIDEDPKSAEIIRPILRGRDIKRYGYDFANLWLINTHNGIKEKNIKRIDIEDYPAIKNHLNKYYSQLVKRSDKGDTPYNLRNCAYMEDFYKQKIVWKIIGDQMAFMIDNKGFIVNNACYILTGDSLVYLSSVLNSKIIKWYSYLTNMNKTGVGDMQIGAQNLNIFPIPIISDYEQLQFQNIVNKIVIAKEKRLSTADFEAEIEMMVYKMYNLTQDEIDFIEIQ